MSVLPAVRDVSVRRGERVFVVGGVVRDLVRGARLADFDLDIVVEGDGIAFAHELASKLGGHVKVHEAFLTAKIRGPFSDDAVLAPGSQNVSMLTEVDVASARTERYSAPGALPMVEPAAIDADLWRRDFSVNALALSVDVYESLLGPEPSVLNVRSEVLDPTGGLIDLDRGLLRVLHQRSFLDDPTRLFRAIRYLERLSLQFERDTIVEFRAAVEQGALQTISARRVWNEFQVALDEVDPVSVLSHWVREGLFAVHPLLLRDSSSSVFEELGRVWSLKDTIGNQNARRATSLLVLSDLTHRDMDLAQRLQVGRQELKLASSLRRPIEDGVADVALLVARYALDPTCELFEMVQSAVKGP